jgi:hypothetical protein
LWPTTSQETDFDPKPLLQRPALQGLDTNPNKRLILS